MIDEFHHIEATIHDSPVINWLRALQENSKLPLIAFETTIMPKVLTLLRRPDPTGSINDSPNRRAELILPREDERLALAIRNALGFRSEVQTGNSTVGSLLWTPSFRRVDYQRGPHGVTIVPWLVTEGDITTWFEYEPGRDSLPGIEVLHALQIAQARFLYLLCFLIIRKRGASAGPWQDHEFVL